MKISFKGKMGKVVSLLVAFSLLWLSGNLTAGERRGATIVVHKKDGAQVKGELIAVKQNSILLLESSSGTDLSIDVPDIKTVGILKKSNTGAGFGYGVLIGGAVGAGIGGLTVAKQAGWVDISPGVAVLLCGVGVGLVGGLIGVMVSGPSEQKIQIEGKSESGLQYELRALKSKARIPDFH